MTKQEIARLVASLTDDELDQLRDFLAEPEDTRQPSSSNGRFLNSLFGGGSD
ncbi:hypothetical protein ACJH6J_24710 [Mycobacterium sp. SMC-18]|uniref:hypothetical protein n=1 Tax=unclassified Mycobacterium TaxID=2642494 RepID=UPI00143884BE|nr:hypothetical protein [Mycobacterium sp. ST-F2]